MRCEKAHCCQPVCGPARLPRFTGLYSHSNGLWAAITGRGGPGAQTPGRRSGPTRDGHAGGRTKKRSRARSTITPACRRSGCSGQSEGGFVMTEEPIRQHLAGTWRFALDPDDRGTGDRWWEQELPDTV
ncbi:MAG: hypothetical protein GX161_05030, partial [Firmicutes bacterium]|nr:hypothetical protein [Bacillota bacterium]